MQSSVSSYLSKKQLSHHTTRRPYIYSSSILSGTKYKFWSTVVSWTDVRNIGFSFYLMIKWKRNQAEEKQWNKIHQEELA